MASDSDKPSSFNRRYYNSWTDYFSELIYLLRHLPRAIINYHRAPISADFRERLLLTVTAVNNCRYCEMLHSQLAQANGVSKQECMLISKGVIPEQTPEFQKPALCYANSWALQGGDFNTSAQDDICAHYDNTTIVAIEFAIRSIWIGNLSGNTWDYWLYRLSFRRWGND